MSSRDMYGGSQRSPRAAQSSRDVMLGPPKTSYASISQPPSARGSPIARNLSSPSQGRRMRPTGPYGVSRSSNSSPLTMATHDYYGDEPDLRVSHRSRSATRAAPPPMRSSYPGVVDQDFMPIRDRSLERGAADLGGGRRGGYRGEDMYRETTIDGDPYRDYGSSRGGGGSFVAELQSRLNELQSQYGSVKRELDATTQKLGSSMHSIKTFWSPELKKERALRKEEAAKYALINDQLKILRSENQRPVLRGVGPFHPPTHFLPHISRGTLIAGWRTKAAPETHEEGLSCQHAAFAMSSSSISEAARLQSNALNGKEERPRLQIGGAELLQASAVRRLVEMDHRQLPFRKGHVRAARDFDVD
ncbi:hypothetical protein HPB50_020452 [Hyalomma asiaticum]|uniref:Uncharacterized protein n=1 Tax=Hyalomma asiaticum TaxID=266040 RepID=A0ACB7S5C0_HYAAI|nr:hypothetical protein HPB50_020452 [Hyalomma asiaticum]